MLMVFFSSHKLQKHHQLSFFQGRQSHCGIHGRRLTFYFNGLVHTVPVHGRQLASPAIAIARPLPAAPSRPSSPFSNVPSRLFQFTVNNGYSSFY